MRNDGGELEAAGAGECAAVDYVSGGPTTGAEDLTPMHRLATAAQTMACVSLRDLRLQLRGLRNASLDVVPPLMN